MLLIRESDARASAVFHGQVLHLIRHTLSRVETSDDLHVTFCNNAQYRMFGLAALPEQSIRMEEVVVGQLGIKQGFWGC